MPPISDVDDGSGEGSDGPRVSGAGRRGSGARPGGRFDVGAVADGGQGDGAGVFTEEDRANSGGLGKQRHMERAGWPRGPCHTWIFFVLKIEQVKR